MDLDHVIFILGASDPEMNHIEMLLDVYGARYRHATYRGEPVTGKTAFLSDMRLEPTESYVFVECRVTDITPIHVIDHHHHGDPGYDAPPESYWEGSSLGQLWCLLYPDQEPPHSLRVVAAADHCLFAAYQGRCPDISYRDLLFFRLQSRSQYQSISVRELNRRISQAMERISALPDTDIDGMIVKDTKGEMIEEMREASARLGMVVMFSIPTRYGEMKVGIVNASHEEVNHWMAWMERQDRCKKVYGMPDRGIAGAYVTNH